MICPWPTTTRRTTHEHPDAPGIPHPARSRRAQPHFPWLYVRSGGRAARRVGAHRHHPHQESLPQARRAFGRPGGDARGAAAAARRAGMMKRILKVLSLLVLAAPVQAAEWRLGVGIFMLSDD